MTVSLLRKMTLCALKMCPCVPKDDDTGCWGECIHCGKRFGFVDRATLRAYADREYLIRMGALASDGKRGGE